MLVQVEFQGEEGTGLGPTLEFYALVAAEFQRTSLGVWLCDDDFPDDESRQVPDQSTGSLHEAPAHCTKHRLTALCRRLTASFYNPQPEFSTFEVQTEMS